MMDVTLALFENKAEGKIPAMNLFDLRQGQRGSPENAPRPTHLYAEDGSVTKQWQPAV